MSHNKETQMFNLRGVVALVGAERHPYAAKRLQKKFPSLDWRAVSSCNQVSKDAAILTLSESESELEGSFTIAVERSAAGPSITLTGGPFSGVIYGVEELVQNSQLETDGTVSLTTPRGRVTPDLTYRTFWTWDHSTNWNLEQIGQQEIGVFNPYGKPPGGFLEDYTRVVDFCSENRIGGIVIYGFLRDSHGGIDSAKKLCAYANERGVRIIPGIAIGAYGGVYWEGSSQYNLSTWLKTHPGTKAQTEGEIGFQIEDLDFPLSFPHSDYTVSACPSDPATMDWMEDSVAWLSDTFDIGGVNIESGDYGVCGCGRCVARRGDRDDPSRRQEMLESWSHADLNDNFPRLFETIKKRRPSAWVYCELQWDNLLDNESSKGLESMPGGAIYQHTVNRTYWDRVQNEISPDTLKRFPTASNTLRTHIGSQWSGDARTERYRNNAVDMMRLACNGFSLGFEGLTVWGEASPHHVPAELSYLAFSRFSFDASIDWEGFLRKTVAPLLGGESMAEEFLNIVEESDKVLSLSREELAGFKNRTLDCLRQAPSEAVNRWVWLAEHISRRELMVQHK